MAKFLLFYLMKPLPDRIREAVPLHVDYWRSKHLDGYSGGPFADRTGGLILFEAESLDRAAALAEADPFIARDLIEAKWVREWLPE